MVQEREPPIGRFYSRLQFNFLVSSVPGARTLQQPHEWSDPWVAESVVSRAFQPDHLNLECLGNTVPRLHVGIILRYRIERTLSGLRPLRRLISNVRWRQRISPSKFFRPSDD